MNEGEGARLTPYELAVPGRRFVEERFPEVQEEAESREGDATDPVRFVNLAAVGRILQEVRGEDDDPELIQQHGYLIYHAYNFWRQGESLFVLETGAARFLVETEPEAVGSAPALPAEAGYLQVPRNLFWSWPEPDDEEAPAEPLDGIFWTRAADGMLWTLAVMGLRSDRPGISIFPLPPVPADEAAEWLSAQVREGSQDFASTLPGGEMEQLYSVETAGEVLKLLGRAFWYMERFPGAVEGPLDPPASGGEGTAAAEEAGAASPAQGGVSSRLPFRRIGLRRGSGEGHHG